MANTIGSSLKEIRDQHIIPVFVKDNEPVISQADFIDTTVDVVQHIFKGEAILSPSVRLSHPIKGRIPEAKDKPANQLKEAEKTISSPHQKRHGPTRAPHHSSPPTTTRSTRRMMNIKIG